jgi:hypothetical protein
VLLAATGRALQSRRIHDRLVARSHCINRLTPLLSHRVPAVRAIGIAGHAIRRLNPHATEKPLNDPIHPSCPSNQARGELGYGFWLPLLKNYTNSDLTCRFQSTWSAARIAKINSIIRCNHRARIARSISLVEMVAHCRMFRPRRNG